jgi:hypothetical protein
MVKLKELEKRLKERYPDKAARIEFLVDIAMVKLMNLRRITLADYIMLLHNAAKEFKEFGELIPSADVIESLLSEVLE